MSIESAYLELLKKCLTGTLFESEPDVDKESDLAYIQKSIEHYIKGNAISMLPIARLNSLQVCAQEVITRGVLGDFIETGVWRGGTTIFMRALLEALKDDGRRVWVADSFEGLPVPDEERFPIEAKHHRSPVFQTVYGNLAVTIEDVRANFERFGLLDGRVMFLKGWFKDTLPVAPIERLAILRLDGDYYESTWDALSSLYDRVSVGGYIIIDDYGEDGWTYCRQAVDDFRRERKITDEMCAVDSKCYQWRRTC